MIDNLIYDKKIRLKRSCILKFMNFLIFRDFSKSFLNFFKIIKYSLVITVMWQMTWQRMHVSRGSHVCIHICAYTNGSSLLFKDIS